MDKIPPQKQIILSIHSKIGEQQQCCSPFFVSGLARGLFSRCAKSINLVNLFSFRGVSGCGAFQSGRFLQGIACVARDGYIIMRE